MKVCEALLAVLGLLVASLAVGCESRPAPAPGAEVRWFEPSAKAEPAPTTAEARPTPAAEALREPGHRGQTGTGGVVWFVPGQKAEEPPPAQPAPAPARPHYPTGPITSASRRVAAGGTTFRVETIDIPLGSATLKVALANGRVGCTESLEAMATRHGAVAAINGSFFDAYSTRSVRNPYGTLITNGQVVHLSDHPTALGDFADGTIAIGQVKLGIAGGLDGSEHYPDNWYAYGVNDYPEGPNWAEVYTPLYGSRTIPDGGHHVVVRNGAVVSVGAGPTAIPADGFVLRLSGGEAYLRDRFQPGRQCAFRFTVKSAQPALDWLSAREALGCGPLLVRDGSVAVDSPAEGFRDPKVLSGSCARSAVGLTGAGHLVLATCPGATIRQLAEVMKALGCRHAMNLDGGASSGLWLRGRYVTRPGRDISNALLVKPVGAHPETGTSAALEGCATGVRIGS